MRAATITSMSAFSVYVYESRIELQIVEFFCSMSDETRFLSSFIAIIYFCYFKSYQFFVALKNYFPKKKIERFDFVYSIKCTWNL